MNQVMTFLGFSEASAAADEAAPTAQPMALAPLPQLQLQPLRPPEHLDLRAMARSSTPAARSSSSRSPSRPPRGVQEPPPVPGRRGRWRWVEDENAAWLSPSLPSSASTALPTRRVATARSSTPTTTREGSFTLAPYGTITGLPAGDGRLLCSRSTSDYVTGSRGSRVEGDARIRCSRSVSDQVTGSRGSRVEGASNPFFAAPLTPRTSDVPARQALSYLPAVGALAQPTAISAAACSIAGQTQTVSPQLMAIANRRVASPVSQQIFTTRSGGPMELAAPVQATHAAPIRSPPPLSGTVVQLLPSPTSAIPIASPSVSRSGSMSFPVGMGSLAAPVQAAYAASVASTPKILARDALVTYAAPVASTPMTLNQDGAAGLISTVVAPVSATPLVSYAAPAQTAYHSVLPPSCITDSEIATFAALSSTPSQITSSKPLLSGVSAMTSSVPVLSAVPSISYAPPRIEVATTYSGSASAPVPLSQSNPIITAALTELTPRFEARPAIGIAGDSEPPATTYQAAPVADSWLQQPTQRGFDYSYQLGNARQFGAPPPVSNGSLTQASAATDAKTQRVEPIFTTRAGASHFQTLSHASSIDGFQETLAEPDTTVSFQALSMNRVKQDRAPDPEASGSAPEAKAPQADISHTNRVRSPAQLPSPRDPRPGDIGMWPSAAWASDSSIRVERAPSNPPPVAASSRRNSAVAYGDIGAWPSAVWASDRARSVSHEPAASMYTMPQPPTATVTGNLGTSPLAGDIGAWPSAAWNSRRMSSQSNRWPSDSSTKTPPILPGNTWASGSSTWMTPTPVVDLHSVGVPMVGQFNAAQVPTAAIPIAANSVPTATIPIAATSAYTGDIGAWPSAAWNSGINDATLHLATPTRSLMSNFVLPTGDIGAWSSAAYSSSGRRASLAGRRPSVDGAIWQGSIGDIFKSLDRGAPYMVGTMQPQAMEITQEVPVLSQFELQAPQVNQVPITQSMMMGNAHHL